MFQLRSYSIINPCIDYDFLSASPWLKLLYYTKAQWCICTSLKMLSADSGFGFRDVKPFDVIFPLMHHGGSIFPFQFSISAHNEPDKVCDGLIFTSSIYRALSLCRGCQCELQCFVEDRGKWKEAVWFLWVSAKQTVPDLLCGRALLEYRVAEMVPRKRCVSSCLSSKGEPAVMCRCLLQRSIEPQIFCSLRSFKAP